MEHSRSKQEKCGSVPEKLREQKIKKLQLKRKRQEGAAMIRAA